MAIYYMPIQNPSYCPTFTYIKKGIKKVEGRKFSPKYHVYKKGDNIIFQCEGEELKTIIKDIRLYKSLTKYLKKEGVENVLPCVKTMKDAKKIYNQWSSHKERKELLKKYGYAFMAIEIQII